jgi:hypothetical protein
LVLGKYDASYYFCQECGFLGAAEPEWFEEAYGSAIAKMDTGLLVRNITLARRCVPVMYELLKKDRRNALGLDYAGGYGVFTRLMRDAGFNYFWADKYAPNLFARGFEYDLIDEDCAVVTAFEVLEHATDPVGLVREALDLANPDTFLFTTELFDGPPPDPDEWWYYAFETGQHVSFYQQRTLERIATQLGRIFTSHKGLHAFSRKPIHRLLKLGGGRLSHLLDPLVRRRLNSRTFSDFELVRDVLGNDP